jgi:hypothetical protein
MRQDIGHRRDDGEAGHLTDRVIDRGTTMPKDTAPLGLVKRILAPRETRAGTLRDQTLATEE